MKTTDVTGSAPERIATLLVTFAETVSTAAGTITPTPEGFLLQWAGDKGRAVTYPKAKPAILRLLNHTPRR